jgi:hypothetical protein
MALCISTSKRLRGDDAGEGSSSAAASSVSSVWTVNSKSFDSLDKCYKYVLSLKNAVGAAKWWRCFNVIEDSDDGVKLQCKDQLCGQKLSCSNPCQRVSHLTKVRDNYICNRRFAHGALFNIARY